MTIDETTDETTVATYDQEKAIHNASKLRKGPSFRSKLEIVETDTLETRYVDTRAQTLEAQALRRIEGYWMGY